MWHDHDIGAPGPLDFENLEGVGLYIDLDKWEAQYHEKSLERVVHLIRTRMVSPGEVRDNILPPCIIVAGTVQSRESRLSKTWLEYEAKRAAIVEAGAIFYEKADPDEDPRETLKRRLNSISSSQERGPFVSESGTEYRSEMGPEPRPRREDVATGEQAVTEGSDLLSEGNEEDLFEQDRLVYGQPPFAVTPSEYETLWSRLKMPDEDWRKDE